MDRRRWLMLLGAALIATGALGVVLSWPEPDAPSGPCAKAVEDPLDPRSLQHALPGAPPPSYATEPPTSGPHQAGRHPGGAVAEPLSGPVQVGALEAGQVLLQHRDLAPDARSLLESLGSPQVVVAPNPALPGPVVASAWRTRQVCQAVDVDVLSRFVDKHAGKGAGHG